MDNFLHPLEGYNVKVEGLLIIQQFWPDVYLIQNVREYVTGIQNMSLGGYIYIIYLVFDQNSGH